MSKKIQTSYYFWFDKNGKILRLEKEFEFNKKRNLDEGDFCAECFFDKEGMFVACASKKQEHNRIVENVFKKSNGDKLQ